MYWLAVTLGVALVAMVVTGGRVSRLLSLPVQALWLLVAGLGIQIELALVDLPADRVDDVGFGLLMLSYALLLAFGFVNIRLRGMAIVTLGLALNAVVVGLNEGMPTIDRRVETRSGREVEHAVERTATERPESDEDLLPFLGQIVRLPDNPIDDALSPGDVVVALGVVVVFVAGGRRKPRRRGASADEAEVEEDEEWEEEEVAMADQMPAFEPTPVPPQPPPMPEPPPIPEPPPVPEPPPEPQPPPQPEPAAAPAERKAGDEWAEWRAELDALAGDLDGADHPKDADDDASRTA